MADTNDELKRIEDELLAEEPQDIDKLMKEFLEEPEPAFDDPDKTEISGEPVAYCNYSNDYGKDKKQDEDAAQAKKKKDDNTIITLLAVAAGLSVGIIGVLVYWLVKYL